MSESEFDMSAFKMNPAEPMTISLAWISVKDEKPDEHDPVFLIVLAYGSQKYTSTWTHKICYFKNRKFYIENTDKQFVATHWMPLPNPPEES